jgi:hypothetical protein
VGAIVSPVSPVFFLIASNNINNHFILKAIWDTIDKRFPVFVRFFSCFKINFKGVAVLPI